MRKSEDIKQNPLKDLSKTEKDEKILINSTEKPLIRSKKEGKATIKLEKFSCILYNGLNK